MEKPKKLIINDIKALAACAMVRSKDETRSWMQYIQLMPDGTLYATDGHRLLEAKGAVEPTGMDDMLLFKLDKLSSPQLNSDVAILHIDGDESRISLNGKKRHMIPVDLAGSNVGLPTPIREVHVEAGEELSVLRVNLDLVYDVAKLLKGKEPSVRLSRQEDGTPESPVHVAFAEGNESPLSNITMTVMPMRRL